MLVTLRERWEVIINLVPFFGSALKVLNINWSLQLGKKELGLCMALIPRLSLNPMWYHSANSTNDLFWQMHALKLVTGRGGFLRRLEFGGKDILYSSELMWASSPWYEGHLVWGNGEGCGFSWLAYAKTAHLFLTPGQSGNCLPYPGRRQLPGGQEVKYSTSGSHQIALLHIVLPVLFPTMWAQFSLKKCSVLFSDLFVLSFRGSCCKQTWEFTFFLNLSNYSQVLG